MANNEIQKLDDCTLYAGSTETLYLDVYSESGGDLELSGFSVEWCLISYSNKYGSPVLKKDASVAEGEGGYNRAVIEISDTDTINLVQTYIQQWQAIDGDNKKHVLAQGNINFIRNIDR